MLCTDVALPAQDQSSSGTGEKPIILITTVDIGEGRTDQITLREGDSPQVQQLTFAGMQNSMHLPDSSRDTCATALCCCLPCACALASYVLFATLQQDLVALACSKLQTCLLITSIGNDRPPVRCGNCFSTQA